MQSEDKRTFVWLMVGACLGAIAVFAVNAANSDASPILGWVAALVPTVSAILFGIFGPMIGQQQEVESSVANVRSTARNIAEI